MMRNLWGILVIGYLAALAGVVALAAHRSDSATLQADINACIANHQAVCLIPTTTYSLDLQLTVPPGTDGLTVDFQGGTLTASATLSSFLKIGSTVSGLWPFTRNAVPLTSPVSRGQTVLKVRSVAGFNAGDSVVLFDQHTASPNTDSSVTEADHRELNSVASVDAVSGTVTLNQGAARDYDPTAELADVQRIVCRQIGVRNVTVDGLVSGADACSDLVRADLVDGLNVSGLTGRNFKDSALLTSVCANVGVDGSLADTGATPYTYGFYFEGTNYVTVTGCSARNCQHGLEVHGGSCNGVVRNFSDVSAPIDMHGMDDERWDLENCGSQTAPADFSMGNAAWEDGDGPVTMNGCYWASFHVCSGAHDLAAGNCRFGQVWFDSSVHAGPSYPPTNLVFQGGGSSCPTFNVLSDAGAVTARFDGFSFASTGTSWGYNFSWSSGSYQGGSIECDNCTFSVAAKGYPSISLTDAGTLTLKGCTLQVNGSPGAIVLNNGFTGGFTNAGCSTNAPALVRDLRATG